MLMNFRIQHFCVVVVFSFTSIQAQNLVVNPSFEDGQPQCDFTIISDFYGNYVSSWSCPNLGTSDIFSSNINKICWGSMPEGGDYNELNPHIGSQSPRTGNRFGGIFTFSRKPLGYENPRDTLYREYLQAWLSEPLVPGKSYCAGMYVSPAEQPRYAANNMGMYFSDDILDITSREHIPVEPVILEDAVISNTTDWTYVGGPFTASSASRYLVLGNFFDNAHTKFIDKGGTHPQAYSYRFAYYFIDDVSVVQFPEQLITTIENISICEGKDLTLQARNDIEAIQWFNDPEYANLEGTGATIRVSPAVTTTYYLKGKFCKWDVFDQITVTVNPFTQPDLGDKTILCEGTTMTLDPGLGYQSYEWNNSSTDSSLVIGVPGRYAVTVINAVGCSGTTEIEINSLAKPTLELGEDKILCPEGGQIKLKVPYKAEESYIWSTGETSNAIAVRQEGAYWMKITNMCGEISDTVKIETLDKLFIPNIITPNEDALNTFFTIQGTPTDTYPAVSIFNRYGNSIFYDAAYKNNWPDSPSRENLSSGIYYYLVEMRGCKPFKGWLQIMR